MLIKQKTLRAALFIFSSLFANTIQTQAQANYVSVQEHDVSVGSSSSSASAAISSTVLFEEWINEHSKEYASTEEQSRRYKIWLNNHEYIQRHNNKNPKPSFVLGHNQFSDLTEEEYHEMNFLGEFSPGVISPLKKIMVKGNLRSHSRSRDQTTATERKLDSQLLLDKGEGAIEDLPESVNWVEDGAVTPVKNQMMCGSCWAFSAVAAIEGARIVQAKKLGVENVTLISLSEQQLLDCDYADHSCMGGVMDSAFEFGESVDGFCSEAAWPYAMRRHHIRGCHYFKDNCTVVPHTKLASYWDVTNTTDALMEAISIQPVSVAIQASGVEFQLYKEGVYNAECGIDLDHGVTAVGYGEENGQKFWLIKNSWGSSWGKFSRNTIIMRGQTN